MQQRLHRLEPLGVGEVEIEQDQVGGQGHHGLGRRLQRPDPLHQEILRGGAEDHVHEPLDRHFVLDHEDLDRTRHAVPYFSKILRSDE